MSECRRVVPTLSGAALGLWLDSRHPGAHASSRALPMAGLVPGCLNAWCWVGHQDRAMHGSDRPDNHQADDGGTLGGITPLTRAGGVRTR